MKTSDSKGTSGKALYTVAPFSTMRHATPK